jgi:uncharacterized protein with PQ loop repeat
MEHIGHHALHVHAQQKRSLAIMGIHADGADQQVDKGVDWLPADRRQGKRHHKGLSSASAAGTGSSSDESEYGGEEDDRDDILALHTGGWFHRDDSAAAGEPGTTTSSKWWRCSAEARHRFQYAMFVMVLLSHTGSAIQISKIVRNPSEAMGISFVSYIIYTLGGVAWLLYSLFGMEVTDRIVSLSSLLSIALNGTILILVVKHGDTSL